MFHHGFYALFLILSFSFGTVVLIFGFFATRILFKKQKKKPITLNSFNALIPKITTTQRALELVDIFFSKFRIVQPKQKDLWLETLKNLARSEFIDTNKTADIREKLIKFNPDFQEEIAECIGIALKTKNANKGT